MKKNNMIICFFLSFITGACTILNNNESVNAKDKKISTEESAYIEYIKAEKKNSQCGEYKYALYDINEDGVDEAIIRESFYGIQVLNYYNKKVNCIEESKYGGVTIYPKRHIFRQTGGHMSMWFKDYYKVKKKKAVLYAEKTWEFDYSKPDGGYTNYKYQSGKKKCSKKTYKKKLAILKNTKVVREKDLKWKKL